MTPSRQWLPNVSLLERGRGEARVHVSHRTAAQIDDRFDRHGNPRRPRDRSGEPHCGKYAPTAA
uniref:Uncharacterized protein n=1 Tax=Anopheles atroparvus TaxID=41427 RepID=A0AAG5DPF4_ANOAO